MTPEQLKSTCIMVRTELERQGATSGIMAVFDTMCAYLGEESRGLNRALAALEEAQQRMERRGKALGEANEEVSRLHTELAEMQQQVYLAVTTSKVQEGTISFLNQTLENLRAERDDLKDHRSALVIGNTEIQGKLQQAEKERERYTSMAVRLAEEKGWIEKDLVKAQQTIARQEEVLEFYAEEGNYLEHIIGWGPTIPVVQDGGSRARKALEGSTQS